MSAFYLIPWGFQSLKGFEHKYFLPAPQRDLSAGTCAGGFFDVSTRGGAPVPKGWATEGVRGTRGLGGGWAANSQRRRRIARKSDKTIPRLLLFSFLLSFLPFPFLWVSDMCHRSSWFNSETCAAETVKNCNKNPDFVSVLNWTRFLFWNFYRCTAVDPEKVKVIMSQNLSRICQIQFEWY